MLTPTQIRPLLEALSHSDAVIVSGQAINREWEPWRRGVREKVDDLIELEAWLRRLKKNPPGP
jgi:hypothetical protein